VKPKNYEAPRYKLSPHSYHFIPLRSKYFPQYPVLRHPQSVLFPDCDGLNYGSLCINLSALDSKRVNILNCMVAYIARI
jgi:hypothetical protein